MPVLIALGADETGSKRLVTMRLCTSEAEVHWSSLIADLRQRGLRAPLLIVGDGHKGLQKAANTWPGARVQRCTVHKLQNLLDHCPVHARRELRRDYRAIVTANDAMTAKGIHAGFVKKWEALCPAVVRSYREAGEQLLTFYDFPKPMWKSLRTTNSIENLNREFRRRTKTQASFSTEEGALTLLYGLMAFGQIRMRRIAGYPHLAELNAADPMKKAS